jgi:BirA family biotin operon repressor/biotin-[acetyl-CoA-carboxylase] ligase
MELGREVSREDLMAALLNHLERLYLRVREGGSVLEEWKARLDTLGRRVRVSGPGITEEGIAEDVDGDGNLVIRRADGTTVSMVGGEVSLRA